MLHLYRSTRHSSLISFPKTTPGYVIQRHFLPCLQKCNKPVVANTHFVLHQRPAAFSNAARFICNIIAGNRPLCYPFPVDLANVLPMLPKRLPNFLPSEIHTFRLHTEMAAPSIPFLRQHYKMFLPVPYPQCISQTNLPDFQ